MTKQTRESIDAITTAEQTRLPLPRHIILLLTHIPTALVFAYVLFPTVNTQALFTWLLILITASLINAFLIHKIAQLKHQGTKTRKKQPTAGALILGVFWAVSALLAIQAEQNTFYLISALLLILVALHIMLPLNFDFGFLSFSLPIVCVIALTYLFLTDVPLVGVMLLAVMITLIALDRKYSHAVKEALQARFESQETISKLCSEKEDAERANSAKSSFLAAASHDLRQPLHAMSLYLDTMRVEPTTERQFELLTKIGIAVTGLSNLFEHLLDISKLDAGTIKPCFTSCPLEEIFHRLEIRFTPLVEEKKLQIKFEHNNLYVFSDILLLERILDNLVSNAIRYTEFGQIIINAAIIGNHIQIQITDTGLGIPKEELNHVFGEFYQLENKPQSKDSGLGLGLSIVKRLCKLLELDLKLSSKLGSGSTFSLTIPKAKAIDSPMGRNRGLDVVAWDISGLRVLVLDDEISVLEAMKELLQRWNCEVHCVRNLEQAKQLVKSDFEPELVLTDYHLQKGVTGIDAIKMLEATCNNTIPCVLITGDTAAERLLEAKQYGYKLLHKPVRASQLRMVISLLLADRRHDSVLSIPFVQRA